MGIGYKFLHVSKAPGSEVLDLLNSNAIGTPGLSMTYRHTRVKDKLAAIPDPYFINLMKGSSVAGTCCFCKRPAIYAGKTTLSFYIRYFSFKSAYRRKQTDERSARNSLVKKEVMSVLDGLGLDVNEGEKFFHYAYVDPGNIRSVKLCKEFGFEVVRDFATIVFNRMNPRMLKGIMISEIEPEEEALIKNLLSGFYRNYTMFTFDNLFGNHKYYVIRDQSHQIVAGVQATPDQWKILSLAGATGKLLLNVFSVIPGLKRLISKNYRFLTLEGIYHAPGCEQYLEILLEGLLAKYRLYSAIAVVDRDSLLYKTLRSLKLGWIDRLKKEVRGDIICNFKNLTENEIASFRNNPAYISGTDVT